MTRIADINRIAENLGSLSEEQLAMLADVTTVWARDGGTFAFTEAEKAAIERSFEDFRQGRTLSLEEAETRSIEFLARRRASRQPT
jgi:hypothetical protein